MTHEELPNKEFHAFICYEHTTAQDLAENLKTSLKKMDYNAFVAFIDMKGIISNEEEYRYSIIKHTKYFILIITKLLIHNSPASKSEIEVALNFKKDIIPCVSCLVDNSEFKCTFPDIYKMQWRRFKNASQLAENVTSLIIDENLKEEGIRMKDNILAKEIHRYDLSVTPEWSLNRVTKGNNTGHIIFRLKNSSDKRLIIHGYRMFRIKPNGIKDVYYNSSICDADDFKKWVSDTHFRIILHKNDEHVFHWDDVNIIETYGINEIGKWHTEVQVAYIIEGSEDLYFSIGTADIEYSLDRN